MSDQNNRPYEPDEVDRIIEEVRAEYAPEPEPTQPQDAFEPDFGNAFDDYGDYVDEEPEHEPAGKVKRKRHLKRMQFPWVLKLVIYLLVVVAIGALAAKYAWKFADDVLALTRPEKTVEVTIHEKDDLDDITSTLKDVGAIEYEWLFKLYCKFTGSEDYFDPGVYNISLTYDYHALVNNLMASAGSRETVTLMIAEGSNTYEIFDLLEENNVCTREKLEEAAASYRFTSEFVRGLPYGKSNRLEGYLFPDTYQFYLMDDPENVIGRFLRNFGTRLDEDVMYDIEHSGYTERQIIIMASIVEAEAANDNERGKIASVIYNRLNNWETPYLGMDSTVYYGALLQGATFSVELDSPYNTYNHPGLPVGPICNPGMNSIRAVLYPEETDYYYFATGVDGMNHFFTNEEDFTAFINSDQYEDIIPGSR